MNLVKRVTTIQVCTVVHVYKLYMHNKAWKRVVVVILYFRIGFQNTTQATQQKQLNKK